MPKGQRMQQSIYKNVDRFRFLYNSTWGYGLPTDANGEGSIMPVAALNYRHLTADIWAWPIVNFMRVAVLHSIEAIMSMSGRRHSPGIELEYRPDAPSMQEIDTGSSTMNTE